MQTRPSGTIAELSSLPAGIETHRPSDSQVLLNLLHFVPAAQAPLAPQASPVLTLFFVLVSQLSPTVGMAETPPVSAWVVKRMSTPDRKMITMPMTALVRMPEAFLTSSGLPRDST